MWSVTAARTCSFCSVDCSNRACLLILRAGLHADVESDQQQGEAFSSRASSGERLPRLAQQ